MNKLFILALVAMVVMATLTEARTPHRCKKDHPRKHHSHNCRKEVIWYWNGHRCKDLPRACYQYNSNHDNAFRNKHQCEHTCK